MKKAIKSSSFYDDGEVHGTENWNERNKENTWRGVPNVRMIWHGEWSDPELEYNGIVANYHDIEDTMYEYAKEDGIDAENDEEFDKYCQEHDYDVYALFDNFIESSKKNKRSVKSSRKPIQSMARSYLKPKYDSRASFYNKAEIDDDKLYSYGKLVAEIIDGKPVLYPSWDYSQTTIRHVREFLRQHGFFADSKAQIAEDYEVIQNSRKPIQSMYVTEDISGNDLYTRLWSGGKDQFDSMIEDGADADDILNACEELLFREKGNPPTMTEVNDLIWFEPDTIREYIGLTTPVESACHGKSKKGKKKDVKSSMQGKEKSIQAIMDEYGCTRKEAEEMLNEDIQSGRKALKSGRKPIKSSAAMQVTEIYNNTSNIYARIVYCDLESDVSEFNEGELIPLYEFKEGCKGYAESSNGWFSVSHDNDYEPGEYVVSFTNGESPDNDPDSPDYDPYFENDLGYVKIELVLDGGQALIDYMDNENM